MLPFYIVEKRLDQLVPLVQSIETKMEEGFVTKREKTNMTCQTTNFLVWYNCISIQGGRSMNILLCNDGVDASETTRCGQQ